MHRPFEETAVEGVLVYSAWDAASRTLSNTFLILGETSLIVNPASLSADDITSLPGAGKVVVVALDRRMDSAAHVFARELDVELIYAFETAESRRIGRARIVPLGGLGTHGHAALHLEDSASVMFGNALCGKPVGAIGVSGDETPVDTAAFAGALRTIWSLEPQNVLLCNGAPVFGSGTQAIEHLLASFDGVVVNRINLDELAWIDRVGPGRLRRRQAEVGLLIGARKLGYQLIEVAAGNIATPMHNHTEEEEFYFVVRGRGQVRCAGSTFAVREGDFISFNTGRSGTHQLLNDGEQPLLVIAVSNVAPGDCCEYPDSDKLLFARGVMRRLVSGNGGADLDYWAGETG
jgi:uncharacterized cupin superfamily protein